MCFDLRLHELYNEFNYLNHLYISQSESLIEKNLIKTLNVLYRIIISKNKIYENILLQLSRLIEKRILQI